MCPDIVTKKGTLSVKCSQARSLCICSYALYHGRVSRPHKAQLNSCSFFSERNMCSIASVKSYFTHGLLDIKKLPIISTASLNICGWMQSSSRSHMQSFFQKLLSKRGEGCRENGLREDQEI